MSEDLLREDTIVQQYIPPPHKPDQLYKGASLESLSLTALVVMDHFRGLFQQKTAESEELLRTLERLNDAKATISSAEAKQLTEKNLNKKENAKLKEAVDFCREQGIEIPKLEGKEETQRTLSSNIGERINITSKKEEKVASAAMDLEDKYRKALSMSSEAAKTLQRILSKMTDGIKGKGG